MKVELVVVYLVNLNKFWYKNCGYLVLVVYFGVGRSVIYNVFVFNVVNWVIYCVCFFVNYYF